MALPETVQGDGAPRQEPLLPLASRQAGTMGVTPRTVTRARALAINAFTVRTEERLRELAASAPRDAPRAFKLSWDETALRFYVTNSTLQAIIGNIHVEPRRVESRRRRADGSEGQAGVTTSHGRPSYVVQVMQSASSALIGGVSGEIVQRPTLCTSTSAADLHLALKPWVRLDLFRTPGAEPPAASQLLALVSDSHPSSKLLVSQIAEDAPPTVPVHDALCLGHQLSLCCDDMLHAMKHDLDIINPCFATQKLMQQLVPCAALYKAIDRDGNAALIIRVVCPPEELRAHAECVLGHTLGDGVEETLYTLRGTAREEFGDKDAAAVADFMKMVNGDWTAERWEHYTGV